MSALVFPSTLPGVQIDVHREILDDVDVQPSLGGKETRFTESTYPRYRYTLNFELLRSYGSFREFAQAMTHFTRHRGRLDSFLLTDPEDSAVTDMGFAVGDGATTAWQIQRTIGGDVIDAAGFQYKAQSKPYVNLLFNSSFETDSNADGLADAWSVYNTTTATEPSVTTIVPGMNGGKAQRLSWGTNNSGKKGFSQSVPFVTGQWYTISFFARAAGSNVGQTLQIDSTSGPSQNVAIVNPALSGAWQRYVWQWFFNVGTGVSSGIFPTLPLASGTFGDIDFDLFQITPGQYGVNDLQPIETAAALAGTRTPSYWPSRGDGFEPVFDLNGAPTIYQDGDWMGRRTLYPWARTNLAPFSVGTGANWGAVNAVLTANSTTAPDGTSTGNTLNEGTAATVQHYATETLASGDTQGELRCYSVWVKANNLPNVFFGVTVDSSGINFNLGTGVIDGTVGGIQASGVITSSLWPGWYRIWYTRRGTASPATVAMLAGRGDGSYTANYTGTSRTFFAWGAMCERVSNLNGPTPYIQTPNSAAATVTDYSLSGLGVVTPATVLPAGAFLSWDGSYYRRVRFENDNLPADRIVSGMWSSKSLALLSVKP